MSDDIDKEFGPIKQYTKEEIEQDGFLKKLARSFGAKQNAKRKRREQNYNFFKTFKLSSKPTEGVEDDDGDSDGESDGDDSDSDEIDSSGSDSSEGEKRDVDADADDNRRSKRQRKDPGNDPQAQNDSIGSNLGKHGTSSQVQPSPLDQPPNNPPNSIFSSPDLQKFNTSVCLQDTTYIRDQIKKHLISDPQFSSHNDQFSELYNLLENTIQDGEGNSALLIGPRGSGKTSLINKCFQHLNKRYENDYLVIRLNSIIHKDDASAVREIASQLSKVFGDNEWDFNVEVRHMSTTLRNILKMLDTNGLSEEQMDSSDNGNMSIIFVIDDLETFTKGSKQTLLYNLFELTQTSKIPICIVGTSTKFTTRELLEKRVRSRFSQRLIVLNKFNTLDEFGVNCINNLKLTDQEINSMVNKNYGHLWNQYLSYLLTTNSNLMKMIMLNFHTVRNIKSLNNCLFLPLSKISINTPYLPDSWLLKYYKNQMNNHLQAMINSLSTLELLLVIAGARFLEKSNLVCLNFNLAYKEYVEMIKQFNIDRSSIKSSSVTSYNILTNLKINTKIYNASVLKNCWVSLYRLGLLIDYAPNTPEGGVLVMSSNRYYVIEDTKMIQLDVNLKEINELLLEDNALKALTKI